MNDDVVGGGSKNAAKGARGLNANVLFWTGAFVNMGVIVVLALAGVKRARARQMEPHRILMTAAAALVIGFVVAYGFKLQLLGREDLSQWSRAAIWTLRFHECCVLLMIVGGGLAFRYGGLLRSTRAFSLRSSDPRPDANVVRRHHKAARTALIGAVVGFVSAGFVLAGMYARLP